MKLLAFNESNTHHDFEQAYVILDPVEKGAFQIRVNTVPSRAEQNLPEGRMRPAGRGLKTPALGVILISLGCILLIVGFLAAHKLHEFIVTCLKANS